MMSAKRDMPLIAEVRPAVDLAKLAHLWDLACGKEDRSEQAKAVAEKTLAETRLEKGRLLAEARKAFPKTGNDGGWSKHLAKWGVERDTALRYMKLAGFVESTSDRKTEVEIPSYTKSGITKPRKAEPAEEAMVERAPPARVALVVQHAPPAIDMAAADASLTNWAERLESLVEEMRRHVSSAFSKAEQIEALCAERSASVSSPAFLTTRSMLTAVKATVADVLKKMESRNG